MKKKLFALAGIFTLGTGAIAGEAFAAEATYKVQKGDTLWDISQQHNITVKQLQEWNELNSSLILPEQELKLASEEQEQTYTVVKGDTLFGIAKHFGISLKDLMQWNSLTSDLIYPGDQLTLKAQATVPTQAPAPKQAAPKQKPAPAPVKPVKQQKPAVKAQSVKTQAPAPSSKAVKEMVVRATAYSENCKGCSGVTATGFNLRNNPNAKVIAVDPSVIPLGTRVWVEGYGEAIALDTGGAIKGNRIDVFIPNEAEVVQWGVKNVKIRILD